MSEILADDQTTCPGGSNSSISEEFAVEKSLSSTPTLRVSFGERAILESGGLHATRSQCVLGLHDYREKICYTDKEVLTAASVLGFPLSADYKEYTCNTVVPVPSVPKDYLRNPEDNLHITHVEGKGFRWRNGALTLQLIDAGIDPSQDLQAPDTMVEGAGTFAKAFTVAGDTFTNEKSSFTEGNSGMLYEATVYWHYSTLVDVERNEDPENTTPPEGGCFGGPGYSGKIVIDSGGTNPAETRKIFKPLEQECADLEASDPPQICPLDKYVDLRATIENAETEAELNQALLDLANLLATADDNLKKLDTLWDYIPEDDKPVGSSDDGSISDGTPVDPLIPIIAAPPTFTKDLKPGRLNWIDLVR